MKVYPYQKGGAEKVLGVWNGGYKRFWGSFKKRACILHFFVSILK